MKKIENFSSNPNQRTVTVNKELCDDKHVNNYYAKINLVALKEAMHSLTPKAFELWLYFSKNQDKHSFYLSKVDFLNWCNIGKTSYYNAFNELVEGNYLIPIDKESQEPKKYNFYEIPRDEEKENIFVTVNKESENEIPTSDIYNGFRPKQFYF